MEIGIRSSSIRNSEGLFVPEAIPVAREAGFRILELNFNHPDTGLDWRDPAFAEAVRVASRSCGMRLVAHAPCEESITSPDPEAAKRAAWKHIVFMERMPEFGVSHLVAHGCVRHDAELVDEAAQTENLTNSLDLIAPVAEAQQVVFSLETMVPGRLSSHVDPLVKAVGAVGCDWLGVCVDTNHSNLSEDVAEAITRASEWVSELHLNDNHGEREEHLLPGQGVVDWESVAKVAPHLPATAFGVIEPNQPADMPLEDWLTEARRAADHLVERINFYCS